LDEFEITCVVRDSHGTISHCGVKGYGIQDISTIEKLIKEEACYFFASDGDIKKNIYSKVLTNGAILLTTDPNCTDTNELDFLPLFDRPLLRQLIESVR
jgi:uncharacterized protein DUF3892